MCSSHPQNSKIIWGFPQPSLNFLLIHQLPRHQIASWTSYFIWRRPSHQLNWTVWCIDFHNCRIVAQSLNFAINLSFVPWNIFCMRLKCRRNALEAAMDRMHYKQQTCISSCSQLIISRQFAEGFVNWFSSKCALCAIMKAKDYKRFYIIKQLDIQCGASRFDEISETLR